MSSYGQWSVALLKNELQLRGIKIQGRKAELVARLEASDKMTPLYEPLGQLPPPSQVPEWPPSGFMSITPDSSE